MLFFLLLGVAALASTVSLLEVAAAYCIDERKWSRRKSVLAGFGALLSHRHSLDPFFRQHDDFFHKLPLIHVSFFEMMDFVWGTLALSVGALFIAIFVGYVWKSANALKEIGQGTKRFRYGPDLVVFGEIPLPAAHPHDSARPDHRIKNSVEKVFYGIDVLK